MKRMHALLLALALLWPALAAAIDPLPFENAAEEARFRTLTAELRCVMCQNQSLADSSAGIAGDLRREIFDMMRAGKSDAEIKDFLVARYGDFVLYDPPLRGDTILLWVAPLAILLGGGIVVLVIVRRRAAALRAAPTGSPARDDAPSSEDW
jgi:cytochrome c-type biogenesis protein CcmH